MLVPGNMWQEVWHSAKPVPASRQKRLFDDTKEAEKVHFVAGIFMMFHLVKRPRFFVAIRSTSLCFHLGQQMIGLKMAAY